MSDVRFCFLVPATLGYGEGLLALDFAKRLGLDREQIVFVVSGLLKPLFEDSDWQVYWLIPDLPELNQLLVADVIRSFRPRCIIVVDYIAFELTKDSVGIEENLLNDCGVPLVNLDIYGQCGESSRLDRLGYAEPKMVEPHRIRFAVQVRPCPLNDPARDVDSTSTCYAVFPEPAKLGRRQREHVRETLGIGGGERLVFFSTAVWQHTLLNVTPWARGALVAFQRIFACLDDSFVLLHVGPSPLSEADDTWLSEDIRYMWFPTQRTDRFDTLLAASDVHVSLNAISTTLSKATALGLPSVLLHNSRRIRADEQSDTDCIATAWLQPFLPTYQYRIWPVGWYDFLEPILAGNPYTDTFVTEEILATERAANLITELAADSGARRSLRERQDAYRQRLQELPTPREWLSANFSSEGQ